ncbi:hypothetical protein C4D60_Mb06t00770 [Musa balbisiana]|uniref:Uncharacterized protein n=1 Tax=Musa balbisiana TaxID=52838 RepID=A0A4V4H3K4_MUSBA|nr:hypothetical protein C4D60_Mb06t00770 [Musa balbisiana]
MLSIVLLVSLAFFGFKYGSCNDWNIIVLCAPVMKKNDEEYIVAENYSGMEKFISQGSGHGEILKVYKRVNSTL